MKGETGSMRSLEPITMENARVGYQVAVDLWTYQGSLNWNRFNVMLATNSIILSVIGVLLSGQSYLPLFGILLPAIGFLLCIVWVFLMARGFDYHKWWGSQALELEEGYLNDVVKIVSDARISFLLNAQSEEDLRNEGVPDEIVEGLRPLFQVRFAGKRKFLKAVKKQIGRRQTRKHEEQILKFAQRGRIKFSWLSRLGGSQKNATFFVISVFAVVYVVVALLQVL